MTTQTCAQGYSWCQGGSPDCGGDHASMVYQPVTLGQGAPIRASGETLSVGIGVRFNGVDGDVAPRVVIHIDGGPEELDVEVSLRPGEAYEVGKLLDAAVMDATSATLSLLPSRLANDLLEVDQ
ncbi:hypothetical protein [Mycolicibacterium phocaicum]|nr:hypothetical protein [Mycolicibacterium phocaicum]